jgi:cysteine desulfurase/selenocysteine lyase
MTPVIPLLRGSGRQPGAMSVSPGPLDVQAIRDHFAFPGLSRIVTNNAASTQPPRELLALYASLAPGYENVHRGQSAASQQMTSRFEESYDTIAQFIGAPGRASIALYRNTTEAINAVMYSLLTEFRDGDNVVTTMMEHNSNYVPWYAMCREILPRLGRRVDYRLARFDPVTGALDLDHGPRDPARRTSLVAFNLAGREPVSVAEALNRAGVESRAGCHCATLAHHALGLAPPASCRLSFYLYNTPDEVDQAVAAVAAVAAGRRRPAAPWYRFRHREPGPRPAHWPAPVVPA